MHVHPLRDRNYRQLFLAQITSLFGTGLSTIALALLAHELSGGHAGTVLGTVLAVKMVSYVLIAPVVGGFAHKLPRKAFLLSLDIGRAAVVFMLPWATELWHAYALIIALNVLAAGFTPVFSATIPDILPDEDRYTHALTLSRLAYDMEALASPMLAGLALMFVSYDMLFIGDAITFLVSASLVATTRFPPSRVPDRAEGIWANATFGVSAYVRTPRLRGLFGLHVAAAAAGAMVIVNTVVYVEGHLGLGDSEMAWTMAASGLGSMALALVVRRVLETGATDRTIMMLGGVVVVLGLIATALWMPGWLGLALMWVALGAGMSAIQTPAGRIVRRSCSEGDRPAYYAAEFALSHVAWLIAYPAAGFGATHLGLRSTLLMLAGLGTFGLLLALRSWPAHDPLVLEHEHDARDEEHLPAHEGPRHAHAFHIDRHHRRWPRPSSS